MKTDALQLPVICDVLHSVVGKNSDLQTAILPAAFNGRIVGQGLGRAVAHGRNSGWSDTITLKQIAYSRGAANYKTKRRDP